MRPLERMLLDASANGTVMNLTPTEVRELIADVAENARFREEGVRREDPMRARHVAQVDGSTGQIARELKEVKDMMQKLMVSQAVLVKKCEFCGSTSHPTDACPTLFEETSVDVNAMGGYQGYNNSAPQQVPPQQSYYRPPFRQQQGGYNNQNQYQQRNYGGNHNQAEPNQRAAGKSLEDIVKDLATSVHQHQTKTDGAIAELAKQVSQLSTAVFELKADPGKLPSQTVQNPKGNVSAVTLQNEMELEEQKESLPAEKFACSEGITIACSDHVIGRVQIIPSTHATLPDRQYKSSISDVPLPLCVQVGSSKQQVTFDTNISAVIQRGLPQKCTDPGAFSIPCTIGNTRFEKCMLDLGASINILPYSIYSNLHIGTLKPPGLMIELADRSCKQLEGVVEDVLVQVGDLMFTADFHVLKTENDGEREPPSILLGRPFMSTARTKIDVRSGTLSMEIEGKVVNMIKKKPPDRQSIGLPHTKKMFESLGAGMKDLKTKPPDCWHKGGSPLLTYKNFRRRRYSSTNYHLSRAVPFLRNDYQGHIKKFDETHPWAPNI